MILLVDLGNTRMKWSTLISQSLSSATAIDNQELDIESAIFRLGAPSAIYVSSVAAEQTEDKFRLMCERRWGVTPIMLQAQKTCCGVTNGYVEPQRLGVDRWAALVAAYRQTKGPVIVIDCGTAVTVDVIDAEGRHLGGWIVPGLTLMTRCLLSGTSQVKLDGEAQHNGLLGANTISCLQRGAEESLVGLIEHVKREMSTRFVKLAIMITGGDAPVLIPRLSFPLVHVPDLVLQGIAAIVDATGGRGIR